MLFWHYFFGVAINKSSESIRSLFFAIFDTILTCESGHVIQNRVYLRAVKRIKWSVLDKLNTVTFAGRSTFYHSYTRGPFEVSTVTRRFEWQWWIEVIGIERDLRYKENIKTGTLREQPLRIITHYVIAAESWAILELSFRAWWCNLIAVPHIIFKTSSKLQTSLAHVTCQTTNYVP